MAVKTLDEFKDIFAAGEFTPDSMLELAEDVADTLNDYIAKLAAAEAATAKVEKEWREKYTKRFFEATVRQKLKKLKKPKTPKTAPNISQSTIFLKNKGVYFYGN